MFKLEGAIGSYSGCTLPWVLEISWNFGQLQEWSLHNSVFVLAFALLPINFLLDLVFEWTADFLKQLVSCLDFFFTFIYLTTLILIFHEGLGILIDQSIQTARAVQISVLLEGGLVLDCLAQVLLSGDC